MASRVWIRDAAQAIRRIPRRGSLFTRIFVVNAAVLLAVIAILGLSPARGIHELSEEAVLLVVALIVILVVNLSLLRRTFAPLERLNEVMRDFEPLRPGPKMPVTGDDEEVVELTRAFNEMSDRLESERRESVRRALTAQEEERRRIAQELHDEVGQSLTAVILHLERLARGSPEDAADGIVEARETARESLHEVRRIAKRLRPEALDELGLTAALSALVERVAEQSGVAVMPTIDHSLPPLDPEAELVVYRVAQEALTNALRHARANQVMVSLSADNGAVSLRVADNGRGPGELVPGNGIQGMRERALLVGAELAIDPGEETGTEVRLDVPSARVIE